MGREVISQVGNVTSNGVDLEVHHTKAITGLRGKDMGKGVIVMQHIQVFGNYGDIASNPNFP